VYDPFTMTTLTPRAHLCGCAHVRPVSSLHAAITLRDATTRTHGRASSHGARGAAHAPERGGEIAQAPAARGYSPPPPAVSPIKGLIDFHTHAAPDVFGRAVDDEELASFAASRQMEAVVFKNHVALTADRAWLARKHVPGVNIFGGIVLNAAVGGLNPEAVEWMWRMQGGYGRVVWFPTFNADNHVRRRGTGDGGIAVVDERGGVVKTVRDILKICARQRLVVHTGHSSAEQALAIIAAARDEGCDRIVVTHAQFEVVGMNETQMQKAAAMGAKMELCALGTLVGPHAPLAWMRESVHVPFESTAAAIKHVGAQHFVLGTDLGQSGNPTPADGLTMFVSGLMAAGVSRAEIETMGREVPGALLMG
jgi:uncharacterized protein DUF6282